MATFSFLQRSIVSKTVLLSTLVLAAVFGLFIFINQMITADIYRNSVEEGIQAKLISSRQEIDRLSGLMEQKAYEIAAAGQVFYSLSKDKKTNLAPLVETYLKATVSRFTDGLGGGLWYEPGVLDPKRRLFGPYVFWDKGAVQFTWDLSSDEYDYPSQSWYTFGLPAGWDRSKPREKAIYWTPPYVDTAGSNALMITADAFVQDDEGRIIGLSTVDWSLEAMLATLDKSSVLAGSRAFLIDHNSDTVLNFTGDTSARMKSAKELPWLAQVGDSREAGVQTFGPVTVDGILYQGFVTSTQSGFAYGTLVPLEELQRPVARQFMTNVVLSSLLALVVLAAIFVMLRWMVRPVRPLVAALERASRGDLRAEEASRKHDEFAVLSRHLQTLLADWRGALNGFRQLLERSHHTAETVNDASRLLTGEAAAMDKSMAGLSAQFQAFERELVASSEKAERIDALARSGREAVTRQKSILDGVSGSWQGFVVSLDRLKAETDATRQAAGSLSGRAAESQRVLFSTLGSIQNIARSAQTIVDMISVINDVAAQTNLLAMNAAIEAAHAGESGRGFSVVATEIRKLAEATSGNAKTISSSLKQVLTTIKTTEQSSAATAEAVKELVDGINEVAASAGDVAAGLESLHHQGDGIQGTLQELGSATDSVQSSSGSIQQISEGMRSDFDRLARDSGQNHKAVADLAAGLKSLEETARSLNAEAEQNQDGTRALERDLARFTIG